MSSQPTDYLTKLKSLDEDFQSYMILAIIFIVLITFIIYMIYLSRLENSECNYMNNLYSSVDGNIRPITENDPDCKLSYMIIILKPLIMLVLAEVIKMIL
jgi:hypothetical protein